MDDPCAGQVSRNCRQESNLRACVPTLMLPAYQDGLLVGTERGCDVSFMESYNMDL